MSQDSSGGVGAPVGKRRIRAIALAIIRDRGRLFVFEAYDAVKGETFYRPLGGGIEFGERGADALAREMREEIGAEIRDVRYLGMLENVFTYRGEPGHEICLLYEARFADPAMCERTRIEGMDGSEPLLALWKPLSEFGPGRAPLYPEGLLGLMSS